MGLKVAPIHPETLLILAGVGVAAWLLYRGANAAAGGLGAAAGGVAQALNPTSDRNLAYRGASGIVSAATGREETLGGWFYDLVNPTPFNPDPNQRPPPSWDGTDSGTLQPVYAFGA